MEPQTVHSYGLHTSSTSCSSVGSIQDLRTGGRWFDPRLGQYFCGGLMLVIATGFFPLMAVHCLISGHAGK